MDGATVPSEMRDQEPTSARPEIRAQFFSFNFPNSLICAVGSSGATCRLEERLRHLLPVDFQNERSNRRMTYPMLTKWRRWTVVDFAFGCSIWLVCGNEIALNLAFCSSSSIP